MNTDARPAQRRGSLDGLWPFVRPYAVFWAGSAAASVAAVTCGLTIPRLVGQLIDDLRMGTPPGGMLVRYAALIVAASAGAGFFVTAMRWMGPVAARRVGFDLRTALFRKITLLDPAYFERNRTGDVLNRFSGDVAVVKEMLGLGAVGLVNLSLGALINLYFMLRLSFSLGLAVLAAMPFMFGVLTLMLRAASHRFKLVRAQQAEVTSRTQEALAGIKLIKATATERQQEQAFLAAQDEYERRVMHEARVSQPLPATARLMLNLTFVLTLFLVARLLLGPGSSAQSLTLGGFVTFMSYLFLLGGPLGGIGYVLDVLQRGAVSWVRLRELLETEPTLRGGTRTLAPGAGGLCFEHVTLRLDGRLLLDDVSFTLPAGKILGVTGRTGAGKSLLGALAVRLRDPTSGRVLVAGVDVRDLTLESLRGAVGLVPQEPFLFSRTIADNIAFGSKATPDQVRAAAASADLLSNIEAFPGKFDTIVGERGVTLSGGQRQRTAIARALARDTPVLILDDALSAVDAETESRILTELETGLEGRTVLLIGHRLNAFRSADEILVLEEGRVVEQGTHEALLALGGTYAELERKQRLAAALGPHV